MPRRPPQKLDLALDYERIEFSPAEIDKARRAVACVAIDATDAQDLLEHLGLMPDQDHWYEKGK